MFFCPDCHVSNRTNAKFCRKCGKSRAELERTEVSVAVADAPPGSQIGEPAGLQTPHDTGLNAQNVEDRSESSQSDESGPAPEPVNLATISPDIEMNVLPDAASSVSSPDAESSLSGHGAASPDASAPECPSCWKVLRATDKFCCWCGEAQPNRVLPFLKLCLECSTFLPEKANFCYSCGTDVGYNSRRKVKVPHELFKDEDSEFFPRFNA